MYEQEYLQVGINHSVDVVDCSLNIFRTTRNFGTRVNLFVTLNTPRRQNIAQHSIECLKYNTTTSAERNCSLFKRKCRQYLHKHNMILHIIDVSIKSGEIFGRFSDRARGRRGPDRNRYSDYCRQFFLASWFLLNSTSQPISIISLSTFTLINQ